MIHVIISVLIFVLTLFIYDELRKCLIRRKLQNFGSPEQMPIIGAASHFLGKSDDETLKVLTNFFNEVKSIPFYFWLGPMLIIGVSKPEDIRIILTSDDCLNKPHVYKFFHCKSSLIATDKEIWKPHRRLLNAAFKPKVLQSFVPILNENSRILIKKLEPYLNKSADLYRTIFIGHMDTITRTMMGSEMDAQFRLGELFYNHVKSIMSGLQYRIMRFWFHSDLIYYKLSNVGREEQRCVNEGNSIIDEIYDRKVKELESLNSKGIDYLNKMKNEDTTNVIEKCLILEREGVFTHENVLDQMRVIILAGIDTSSTTVFGTLLLLAINQNHQELVVEEMRSILDSADCDVTYAHLAGMEYLERVIKESMRLIPPIPMIGRKPSTDIEVTRGTIPKGAFVLINILHLHRNPKIWGENATEFNPDRFLPENIAKRPPFSYIPFSGGARNCIGSKYAILSAKIILANLLRRFKFTTDLKFEDIHLKAHIILEIINENALRIEKRNLF